MVYGSKLSKLQLLEIWAGSRLSLPDDYCEFLLRYNGGVPRPSGISTPGEDSSTIGLGNKALIENLEAELNSTSDVVRHRELASDIEFLRNAVIPCRVARLYGAETSPLGLRQHLLSGSLPDATWVEQLLPIGEESGGTPIWLSLGDDYGAVYMMIPEYDDTAVECEDLKLASSFSDFLFGLTPARVRYSPGFVPLQRHVSIFRLNEYDP